MRCQHTYVITGLMEWNIYQELKHIRNFIQSLQGVFCFTVLRKKNLITWRLYDTTKLQYISFLKHCVKITDSCHIIQPLMCRKLSVITLFHLVFLSHQRIPDLRVNEAEWWSRWLLCTPTGWSLWLPFRFGDLTWKRRGFCNSWPGGDRRAMILFYLYWCYG